MPGALAVFSTLYLKDVPIRTGISTELQQSIEHTGDISVPWSPCGTNAELPGVMNLMAMLRAPGPTGCPSAFSGD